jgi:hypothetical protein
MNFFTQRDKQLHALGCFGLTIVLSTVMPLSCAVQAVILIGIGKEVYDLQHPLSHTADVMDILADVIGIYAGAAFVLLIHHLSK